MTTEEDLCLIQNAKIYVSGESDYSWMVFDRKSGFVRKLGRADSAINEEDIKEVIDCSGRRVLPGLHESHIHVGSYGLSLVNVKVAGCGSIEELQSIVTSFAEANPDREWILGAGWEQDKLGRYPTRGDLDLVCPGRPVLLYRVCLHIAVANSKALQLAGIDRDTPDPEDGQIDRYPEDHPSSGEPTGIIREAVDQYFDKTSEPSDADKLLAVKVATEECLKHGITSVHALEGHNTWDALCDLERQGQLPIRVFYVAYWKDKDIPGFPRPGESRGQLLSCDRIKIFSDGALGPCTAAISKPYVGSSDNMGLLLHSQSELNTLVSDATSRGYRLEIHAIGDAAADAVLTSLEAGKVAPEKRPIIVHCQILRKDLIDRMKSRGAIASIQPQFVPTDARWISKLLPDELHKYAYAWKTLLDNGVACCGGSDAPVESPQPLLGIYDAIYRPTGARGSHSTGCYKPDEALTVYQAIDIYTRGAAYATMREHDLGQLLPGYQADFIVLDTETDPVQHPELFCTVKTSQAWVAGKRKL